MSIANWPKSDRPREKLYAHGETTLTEAELIAICLNTGIRGYSAVDLAKQLLLDFGGLNQVLEASFAQLKRYGIGLAKYAQLKAAAELGKRRYENGIFAGDSFDNSHISRNFIMAKLKHQQSEVFACVFLDSRLRLIRYEALFHGTINYTHIYPREIVRRGLSYNAAKIILAHNHPSGDPSPSHADKEMTHHIQAALQLVDITVIDHIIVGADKPFSFADHGLLISV